MKTTLTINKNNKYINRTPVRLSSHDENLIVRAKNADYKKQKEKSAKLQTRKTNELIAEVIDRADDGFGYFSNAITGLPYFLTQVSPVINFINNILNAIPWLSTIALIFNSLIRAVQSGISKKDPPLIRAIKIITAVGALGLGIAAMVVTSLWIPLMVASVAVDVFHNFSDVISSFYKYFSGSWKKTREELKNPKLSDDARFEKTNEIIKHRKEMADAVHIFVLSAVTLAGAILLFTPAAPVGAAILLATGIYGVLDRFHLNPFKRLGSFIFGNPFKELDKETFLKQQAKKQNEFKNTATPTPNNAQIQKGLGLNATLLNKNTNDTSSSTPDQVITPVAVKPVIKNNFTLPATVAPLRFKH